MLYLYISFSISYWLSAGISRVFATLLTTTIRDATDDSKAPRKGKKRTAIKIIRNSGGNIKSAVSYGNSLLRVAIDANRDWSNVNLQITNSVPVGTTAIQGGFPPRTTTDPVVAMLEQVSFRLRQVLDLALILISSSYPTNYDD